MNKTPASPDPAREAFEAWAKTAYPNSNTPHNAWIVWQAALASLPAQEPREGNVNLTSTLRVDPVAVDDGQRGMD